MVEKNIYISYLRVIATLFVVLIHASTGFLNHFSAISFDWNYANWINAATRCSVPIFIAISGALLLPKTEDSKEFYSKRIPKLFYPFVFWTFIYIIYYFSKYPNFQNLPLSRILSITWDKLLHGANAHLWYLYMIIGLYLTIPFLKKIIQHASDREIKIFLGLWFLSMFVKDKMFTSYLPKIDLSFFSGYIGYLVLGYYLNTKKIQVARLIPYIGYILMVIFTAYATWYISKENNKYTPTFYNYVYFNTAIATACLFLAVKNSCLHQKTLPNWIRTIDNYSFSIYLIHILPLNYIHPWVSKFMGTALVIPVATVLTIIASILIAYLLKRLPYGKYITG